MSEESYQNTELNERLIIPDNQEINEPDFVRVEKNIAAFGFFTPSSKRIENIPKTIKFTQTFEGSKVEAQVKISGNVEYGMPITSDQDKYLAFQKILDRIKQEKGKIENPIAFTTAELLSLLGNSKNGNRYKEVEEWLKVMNTTFIESEGAVWIAGKKRFASDSFVIFQRVRRTGQELDDGTLADKNYVWLSDWYLENLNNYYLLPIDFDNYKLLKNNISKALIPLLQIWLYASREHRRFEKRYSEICQTLNIKQYNHLSDINRFFGKSLDELVEHQYLSSWEIEKTTDKKDFKIIFFHGFKFYSDQAKTKRHLKKLNKASQTMFLPKSDSNILFQRKNSSESKESSKESGLTTELGSAKYVRLPKTLSVEQKKLVKRLFDEFQISLEKGIELVTKHLNEVKKQLSVYSFRNIQPNNKSGYLIDAIEKNYSIPEAFYESRQKKAEETRRQKQGEAEEKRRKEEENWLRRRQYGEHLYAELSDSERKLLTSRYEKKLQESEDWKNIDFSISFQKDLFNRAVQWAIQEALLLREELK